MIEFGKPASAGRSACNATKLGLMAGAASLALVAAAGPAMAQGVRPQDLAGDVSLDEIVVTGSLIRGAPVVGVPVTSLGQEQFAQQAATTVSDLFRRVPAMQVMASTARGANASNRTSSQRANIHLQGASRTLMLIDGMRFPLMGVFYDGYDPSIIPAIALQRVDVLATGASSVYGSDAIAGVMNLILRRNFDGATTQVMRQFAKDGGDRWQISQLFGRTWDAGGGGGITASLDYQQESALMARDRGFLTYDFTPYGLDNRTPLRSSIPATVSIGNPSVPNAGANPVGFSGSGCTNCFLVPRGQNGVGLTWAQIAANPMVPQTNANPVGRNNLVNPLEYAEYTGAQKRIMGTMAFNQRLTDNVEFFADFFFNHRRLNIVNSPAVNPWVGGTLANIVVPTNNPYRPTGAPAGNLVVNYSTALELNLVNKARETSRRWATGFNIDLPYEWHAKVFYANNLQTNYSGVMNAANANNVNAAMGNIVGDPDGRMAPYMVGTAPRTLTAADIAGNASLRGYAPGTAVRVISPNQVPFLNVFCDPQAFQCNDQRTLDFIKGHSIDTAVYTLQQAQAQADGPLFSLPAGQVRAAVGVSWVKENLDHDASRTFNNVSAEVSSPITDIQRRNFWSAFGQVNIPLVSEEMAIPLVNSLNVELSGRFDDYSDFGSTKNPQISAAWEPVRDLTLRASWGKSFAAPAFQYIGILAAKNVSAINQAAGAPSNNQQLCTTQQVQAGATPAPGTAAAAVLGSIGAANCSDAAINAALAALPASHPYAGFNLSQIRFPGALSQNGGAGPAYGIVRPPGTLGPERSTNWSLGFGFQPTNGIFGFLRGLDVNATYWHVEIRDFIGSPSSNINAYNDPEQRQFLTIRGADATNPAAPFNVALQDYLNSPTVNAGAASNARTISILQDSMARNLFRQRIDGVDFGVTYQRDMFDLGRFTVGLTGTYYLQDITRNAENEMPRDSLNGVVTTYGVSGNTEQSRVFARGQLGWRDNSGTWDANLFMNYRSHYINNQAVPPTGTLERHLGVAAGSLTGDALAQALQRFMFVPAYYTYDLSVGYNLGDRSASPWLRDVQLRLTVNNIFDAAPPFFYRVAPGGAGPVAFDPTQFNPQGRIIALQATKNW